jgi:hypothetical protein
MGLNPTQGMDVPMSVQVAALQWADPPSKERERERVSVRLHVLYCTNLYEML